MKKAQVIKYQDYMVEEKPYYEVIHKEVEDFQDSFYNKRPMALIGPTGCGKTTLATYMAYTLRQDLIDVDSKDPKSIVKKEYSKAEKQHDGSIAFPYIEIPCHEDLSETYLIGHFGLNHEWLPGPLYIGATHGGIVVLDEIVEARKDVNVLIHRLTDDNRVLPVARKGEVIIPPDNFMLVICYNQGYQVKSKDLKPSTKQRFPTQIMDYPPLDKEVKIVTTKTGVDEKIAEKFVKLAAEIRHAKQSNSISLQEGASTRLLVMAGEKYEYQRKTGRTPDLKHISRICILNPITSDDTDLSALEKMLDAF